MSVLLPIQAGQAGGIPESRVGGRVFFGGLVALCPAGCQMLEVDFDLPACLRRLPPFPAAAFRPAAPNRDLKGRLG